MKSRAIMHQEQQPESSKEIDVTHLLGNDVDTPERRAWEAFRVSFDWPQQLPNVRSFRACVEASDAWLSVFHTEAH